MYKNDLEKINNLKQYIIRKNKELKSFSGLTLLVLCFTIVFLILGKEFYNTIVGLSIINNALAILTGTIGISLGIKSYTIRLQINNLRKELIKEEKLLKYDIEYNKKQELKKTRIKEKKQL